MLSGPWIYRKYRMTFDFVPFTEPTIDTRALSFIYVCVHGARLRVLNVLIPVN